MAVSLGQRLGLALAAALSDDDGFDAQRTVIVPMPMPWQRRLYRGIDHARLIADGAARVLRVPVRQWLAVSNGPPQVSLSSTGRRARRGVRMRLRPTAAAGGRLPDVLVLLVDDVRTSGGSLDAAARLLRRLGPRQVVAGVLAVTDDPARRAATNLPSLTHGR